jgi:cyclase
VIRAGLAALLLTATGPPAAPPGRLVPLAPHAWAWISGDDRSANGAIFAGDSAALVVDPGLTPALARELLARAARVTGRPVRYVVLTHWHPDHALGVTCLPDREVTVWSSPSAQAALAERAGAVARSLAGAARTDAERRAFADCTPRPPDRTVADRHRFDLGGVVVEAFAPGPAHTDGDLVVWAPAERVLATGDVMMHRACPDMGEGHPAHWLEVLDSLVALEPRAVVAGHFGPSTPADLTRFRDYLAALIDQVRIAFHRGDPPDGIAAAIQMPDFQDFAQYPQYQATFAGNAARVLAELLGNAGRR